MSYGSFDVNQFIEKYGKELIILSKADFEKLLEDSKVAVKFTWHSCDQKELAQPMFLANLIDNWWPWPFHSHGGHNGNHDPPSTPGDHLSVPELDGDAITSVIIILACAFFILASRKKPAV